MIDAVLLGLGIAVHEDGDENVKHNDENQKGPDVEKEASYSLVSIR